MKIKLFTHSDNDGLGCAVVLKSICIACDQRIEFDYTICEPSSSAPNFIDSELKKFHSLGADEICKYDYIFITDLSPSVDAETLLTLQEMNRFRKNIYDDKGSIVLLDHHKTSPFFENNILLVSVGCRGGVKVIDENGVKTCGTTLLYEYLVNNFNAIFSMHLHKELADIIRACTRDTRIDMLRDNKDYGKPHTQYNYLTKLLIRKLKFIRHYAEAVRLYDTWDWQALKNEAGDDDVNLADMVLKMNNLAKELKHDQFIKGMVFNTFDNEYVDQLSDEYEECQLINMLLPARFEAIADFISESTERYVTTRIERAFIKDKIAYVTADKYASEIGNGVCLANPEINFCAIISGNIISLRTVKDSIDVSEIAKGFGGGGHSKAAGFSIPIEKALSGIMDIF